MRQATRAQGLTPKHKPWASGLGECRGQSREERACGPRGAYVTLMAEMIACALSASSHSAAAFSACQVSCLPWKAGSVSQNSSRLDLSWPIVIGVSELHTGAFRQRSLFPGPGTAHHVRVFADAHVPQRQLLSLHHRASSASCARSAAAEGARTIGRCPLARGASRSLTAGSRSRARGRHCGVLADRRFEAAGAHGARGAARGAAAAALPRSCQSSAHDGGGVCRSGPACCAQSTQTSARLAAPRPVQNAPRSPPQAERSTVSSNAPPAASLFTPTTTTSSSQGGFKP